jgi:coenzyme F420-reducing hydrogenase gamma subunit
VYANPEYISALDRSLPIGSFVHVDFELRGCPINKFQLIEVIVAHLHKRKPNIPSHSVCIECKLKGNVCVMVSSGTFCLGPVTQVGCGALCPSFQRGCYGCFGPMDSANTASLSKQFVDSGATEQEIKLAFRNFNAYAEAFRRESDSHE